MAVGGQNFDYDKFSKAEKIGYWCCFGLIASFIAYGWFFYEPPKKGNEVRRSQTQSSSATPVKR